MFLDNISAFAGFIRIMSRTKAASSMHRRKILASTEINHIFSHNNPSKMYTLDVVDSFRITEPADTYVYDIIPVASGLAAISSDDSVWLLDPLALNGGPVHSIKHVHEEITCLEAVNTSTEESALIICTAGRDGRVVLLDPRSGGKIGELRTGEYHLICLFLKVLICEFRYLSVIYLFERVHRFRFKDYLLKISRKVSLCDPLVFEIPLSSESGNSSCSGACYIDFKIDQNAPVLSLACSSPYGLAAGTELTSHQACVMLW